MRTKDMTTIASHRDFFNQVSCACALRICPLLPQRFLKSGELRVRPKDMTSVAGYRDKTITKSTKTKQKSSTKKDKNLYKICRYGEWDYCTLPVHPNYIQKSIQPNFRLINNIFFFNKHHVFFLLLLNFACDVNSYDVTLLFRGTEILKTRFIFCSYKYSSCSRLQSKGDASWRRLQARCMEIVSLNRPLLVRTSN
jgi:hypothetical protein